jgi:hypothetical protein
MLAKSKDEHSDSGDSVVLNFASVNQVRGLVEAVRNKQDDLKLGASHANV